MYNTVLMVFFDHQKLQVTSFPSKVTIAINMFYQRHNFVLTQGFAASLQDTTLTVESLLPDLK